MIYESVNIICNNEEFFIKVGEEMPFECEEHAMKQNKLFFAPWARDEDQGGIFLYNIDKYWILANDDTYKTVVQAIADDMYQAILETLRKWHKYYYECDPEFLLDSLDKLLVLYEKVRGAEQKPS